MTQNWPHSWVGEIARRTLRDPICFFADVSEEQERLELRSRTEVRLTEGETEESVIYQFAGKTAQD